MINIQINVDKVRESLNGAPDLIEKAIRSTLRNAVAFGSPVQKEIETSIRAAIPTATKFTAYGGSDGNSGKDGVDRKSPIYVSYPPSDGGELKATVGVKARQASYLQFMVKGVPRDEKTIERRYPDGRLLLPTRAIKLDRYGNVPKAQFIDIVRNAQSKTNGFFYLPSTRGGMAPGIYQRQNGSAVPMFWSVDSVNYKKQWDFFRAAEQSIMKHLPDAMNNAIARRLKDYRNVK